MLGHLFGFFLTHRPPQHICSTQRITTDQLGDLHHLFLIDDNAVGRCQAGFERLMEIVDLLQPFFTQNKVVHHPRAQRARTVECQHSNNVFEAIRGQLLEQLLHALRFHLEDGGGVGIFKNLVRLRIVKGQGIQIRALARQTRHIIERQLDNRQVTQAQKVELHQTHFFYIIFIVLTNNRIATRLRIERTEIGELARRNQHTTSVHAHVTR